MNFSSSLVKKVESEEKSINLDGLFNNMVVFEGKEQALSGGLNNISQF